MTKERYEYGQSRIQSRRQDYPSNSRRFGEKPLLEKKSLAEIFPFPTFGGVLKNAKVYPIPTKRGHWFRVPNGKALSQTAKRPYLES